MVAISAVSKRFGSFSAVDDVNFEIRQNEFFALLGPSGCGKTTLLRMIAGLEVPTEGAIFIDGQDVTAVPANRRPVNMVFQSYAVFPHMTVAENIAYGLKVVGRPRSEIEEAVRTGLDMVQLAEFAHRKPHQLSGGQRQRVALARALVKRPKVLLLDEPLSALDAKLREQMQLELAHLQQRVGITFVIVTHDQDEALSMADRIAVMERGKVRQIASPGHLYERPANRFVADFIGKVNLLDGEVKGVEGGKVALDVAGLGRMAVPFEGRASGKVALAVRPEKIQISKTKPAGDVLSAHGRVTDWAYYGDVSHMYIASDPGGVRLAVTLQNETRETMNSIDIGDEVWLAWSPNDALILTE
ncbi:MAG: polyamine ABC transporter ATP-binding protein [Rhizobiales bacterium]|nr:polyamine ABC transporter ATP-binding protein [Hyphomicrobiales bacterium]